MLEAVKEISVEAGRVIMEVYNDPLLFNVEYKADESPITLADKSSNEIICNRLKELTPDIPIISEENKEIPFQERKGYRYAWIVDPVDGTKEFINRNGDFTVNIALLHQGRPVLGVVYVPVTNELYWGIDGQGAFKSTDNGKAISLKAKSYRPNQKGLKIVCSRSHLNDATQAFIDGYDTPEKVSRGSSLKFLLLAEGEAHIYPRMAPTMEWDTAAADIILAEAGGRVLDGDTQKPLQYNKENLLNPYFVAYADLQE